MKGLNWKESCLLPVQIYSCDQGSSKAEVTDEAKGSEGSWWERVLEAKESDLSEGPGGDTPIYNLFKLFMA